MAKYIIDIPEEHENDYIAETPFGKRLFFPLRITDVTYSLPTHLQVEEYTDDNREEIENEVWEFVRMFSCLGNHAISEIGDDKNATDSLALIERYSYQQTKAKYDAWKKEKEEIHVGDEVTSKFGDGVVIDIVADESVHVLGKDGHWNEYADGEYRKTGRHFDEVEKLLERMKAE